MHRSTLIDKWWDTHQTLFANYVSIESVKHAYTYPFLCIQLVREADIRTLVCMVHVASLLFEMYEIQPQDVGDNYSLFIRTRSILRQLKAHVFNKCLLRLREMDKSEEVNLCAEVCEGIINDKFELDRTPVDKLIALSERMHRTATALASRPKYKGSPDPKSSAR